MSGCIKPQFRYANPFKNGRTWVKLSMNAFATSAKNGMTYFSGGNNDWLCINKNGAILPSLSPIGY